MQVIKVVTLTNDQYCDFINETTNETHEVVEIIFINNDLQTVIFKKLVKKAVKQLSVAQVSKHILSLSDDFAGFKFWDVERNEKGQIKIYHEKSHEIFYQGSGIGAKRFLNKYKQVTMWQKAIASYATL